MKRISIVGPPGSGKTTLARALSERLQLTHIELDRLFHMPGWQPRPRDDFRALVTEAAAAERWVTDGNYQSKVQDIVWTRADTVVWLDLPRRVVLPALLGRTLWRGATGAELWNGNRERLGSLLNRSPEENLMLWCIQNFPRYRARYTAASTAPEWSRLDFVRLRSRRAIAGWLAGL